MTIMEELVAKQQKVERQIIESMQNHDFYTAHYLDKCQKETNTRICNLIANDKNINQTFSNILKGEI